MTTDMSEYYEQARERRRKQCQDMYPHDVDEQRRILAQLVAASVAQCRPYDMNDVNNRHLIMTGAVELLGEIYRAVPL